MFMLLKLIAVAFIWLSLYLCHIDFVHAIDDGCNEYVCGSIVSKCLLTQSCQCKLSDCYCCKDCLHCLGNLYIECCSWLDMCPKQNDTLSALLQKSQIGDFEGVPELFESFTSEEVDDRWKTIRFPMRPLNGKRRLDGDAIDRQATAQKTPTSINCTVVYLNHCTTNKKCAQACESMGANSYRWFHDGCCECVGSNCINYGINENRCASCPEADEENELDGINDDDYGMDDDEMMWNYGEDETNFN